MAKPIIFSDDERRRIQRTVEAVESQPQFGLPPLRRPWRPSRPGSPDPGTVGGGRCDCAYIDVGTQDCLGGTGNAPTVLVIADLGFLGEGIILTYDGDCTYIGDEIEHDCTPPEEE